MLVGDVRVGDRANIWFGAVLRGDSSHIEIGAGSSIQDNAVVHCAEDLPTIIGADVLLGHGAKVEGCVIEDHALSGRARSSCSAPASARARWSPPAPCRRGRRDRRPHARRGRPRAREEGAFRVRPQWTDTAAEHYQDTAADI